MGYRGLADVVVVVHLGFVAFVALGGFIAWRWPRALGAHLAAVAWGAGIVVVGWDCPLTAVERWARRRGGETVDGAGFVDRYLEGVLYPGDLTPYLRVVVAVAIAGSWWVLWYRHRRRPPAASMPGGSAMRRSRTTGAGPTTIEPAAPNSGRPASRMGTASRLRGARIRSGGRA